MPARTLLLQSLKKHMTSLPRPITRNLYNSWSKEVREQIFFKYCFFSTNGIFTLQDLFFLVVFARRRKLSSFKA